MDLGYPIVQLVGLGWIWIMHCRAWTGHGPHHVKMDIRVNISFWIWTLIQFQVYTDLSLPSSTPYDLRTGLGAIVSSSSNSLTSDSAISAAPLTMNPDDKIGNSTVAEVRELIQEQIGKQINKQSRLRSDTHMKHTDSYFGPDGAVGKLTASVHKLPDVRESDQQTNARGLAISAWRNGSGEMGTWTIKQVSCPVLRLHLLPS